MFSLSGLGLGYHHCPVLPDLMILLLYTSRDALQQHQYPRSMPVYVDHITRQQQAGILCLADVISIPPHLDI